MWEILVVFVKFCFGIWLTRKSKRTALNMGSWEKFWKAEMAGGRRGEAAGDDYDDKDGVLGGVGGRGVSSLAEWVPALRSAW